MVIGCRPFADRLSQAAMFSCHGEWCNIGSLDLKTVRRYDVICLSADSTGQRRHFSIQVVITHGVSSAAVVWQQLATKLASNGFRVLVYGEHLSLHLTFASH